MPGMMRNAKVWLGLADDDELDDYDAYDDAPPAPVRGGRNYADQAPDVTPLPVAGSTIRPLMRDSDNTGGITITPRQPSGIRPITPVQSTKVQVVTPTKFSDAKEIGDRFKKQQPVIVNLQSTDRELLRRMIDFCSGVTYALGGKMDRVADEVFLLTPTNVEQSEDERKRLQEKDYRS